MPRFIAHDSRLHGSINSRDPRRSFYHLYSPACPLSKIAEDFERDFNNIHREFPLIEKIEMEIWAHGLERGYVTNIGSYDRHIRERRFPDINEEEASRRLNEMTLGYGIKLCREILSLSTIHHLEPLRGKINTLTLNVCGAARIASAYREFTQADLDRFGIESLNRTGDGHEFCSALASRLNCIVHASTESQIYISDEIDWGYREGLWVTYGTDGRLSRTARRYRSGYTDSRGITHANETGPLGQEVRLD